MEDITKEKVTFNISRNVLEELDDCWIKIRKMRKDRKVSKSEIVESAILDAIEGFKKLKK